ncbi:alpha/beta fold hydrolase [Amycolatopsis cynarae]|uniref:Alpha/beta fold hydrolase n=1 Tax=Amycolatopsis cynarae TaxID=2995223 RepID=A0ABY7B328_9PSEU|nr:alpha/beta fold hydrolase [Amycolatopsis sp. HUAS 11-8]WAL66716.1 alpha/beta fold hydrolase [Amycolatopsis sp. HUAS 11-8]
MLSTLFTLGAATALALSAVTATPASAGERAELPVVYSSAAALAYAAAHPDTPPPGANDWSCKPSSAHPRPVVLVHGTLENMTFNWFALSPLLANAGYCVFALNYGQVEGIHLGVPGASKTAGVGPIQNSAAELGVFVDKVLAATGASQVDVIGHSQGGTMPRYYLKYLGGAPKVGTLIGLSPGNHGSTALGLAKLPGVPELLGLLLGTAIQQQVVGSPFITDLNAGGETQPGVHYTVIQSRWDEIATPYTTAFLNGAGVDNILLQDHCPLVGADHLSIPFDSIAARWVFNALDPAHATTPPCYPTLPFNGA